MLRIIDHAYNVCPKYDKCNFMSFWNTLTLTAFGFFLSGVVGTWITYVWQSRNWRHQQDYARGRDLLSKQIQIVEELSDLIGHRRYRTFRALAALRSGNSKRIEKEWSLYDESVIKWNDSINSNITKLRQFFDKRAQYDLELYITASFQNIGSQLEEIKRDFDASINADIIWRKSRRISIQLEDFGGHANSFIGNLWRHIDGIKKELDGRPHITFDNSKKLSTWYLLKNIFELRVKP